MSTDSLDEFKNLLEKIVENKKVSIQFLNIYETEINSLDNLNTNSTQFSKISIGLLFFSSLTNFVKSVMKKREISIKDIDKIVAKFDSNEIDDLKAKEKLSKLIKLNQKFDLFIPFLKNIEKNMLYSPERLAIDINKTISFINGKIELDLKKLSKIYYNYYSDFEKNTKYLDKYKEKLQSQDLKNIIDYIVNKINNMEILIDISDERDKQFNEKLITMFENYFQSLSAIDLSSIYFNQSLPETLADKNNMGYFFKSSEKVILSENIQTNTQISSSTEINPQTYISTTQGNPWDVVGSIVVNPVNKGIGIAGYPYIFKNNVFISVIIEKEIDLDLIEKLYHRVSSLRISSFSDSTIARKEILINEISESLNTPKDIALFPTIVLDFLYSLGIDDFPFFKTQVLREEYIPYEKIIYEKNNHTLIIPDDMEAKTNLRGSNHYSSPSIGVIANGKSISLSTAIEKGKVVKEISFLIYGKYLCIELDFPNEIILEKLITRIRSKDDDPGLNELWKLRFTIGKIVDVFEAEALLPSNIWKYIWIEKILINPYEILSSFIGLVPSGAISLDSLGKDSIQLSRGIGVKPIEKSFNYLYYTVKSEQNITLGMSIGIKLINNEPVLVYCPLSVSDILHKLGRDTSFQSQEKLAKRISKAFSIKIAKKNLLHIRNVLTYLLFYSVQFNYFIDFTDLELTLSWLEDEFEFKFAKIDSIKQIKKNEVII